MSAIIEKLKAGINNTGKEYIVLRRAEASELLELLEWESRLCYPGEAKTPQERDQIIKAVVSKAIEVVTLGLKLGTFVPTGSTVIFSSDYDFNSDKAKYMDKLRDLHDLTDKL